MSALLDLIPKPLLLAVSAALLALCGWLYVSKAHTEIQLAQEKENVSQLQTAIAQSTAAAAEQAQHFEQQARQAEQVRAEREKVLAADAASARAAADSLRKSIAAIGTGLRADPSSIATSVDTTSTVGDVLGDCAIRYSELAEKADRHAADAQALMDAWPK